MPESCTIVGRWSPEHWHSHPCWVLYKQGAIPVCISSPKMQSSVKSRKSSARVGKEEGRGQSRTNLQTSSHKGPGGVILGAGGVARGGWSPKFLCRWLNSAAGSTQCHGTQGLVNRSEMEAAAQGNSVTGSPGRRGQETARVSKLTLHRVTHYGCRARHARLP